MNVKQIFNYISGHPFKSGGIALGNTILLGGVLFCALGLIQTLGHQSIPGMQSLEDVLGGRNLTIVSSLVGGISVFLFFFEGLVCLEKIVRAAEPVLEIEKDESNDRGPLESKRSLTAEEKQEIRELALQKLADENLEIEKDGTDLGFLKPNIRVVAVPHHIDSYGFRLKIKFC